MKKGRQLNGAELASYIQERQVQTARGLKQAWGVNPKLAIITTTTDEVIDMYIRLKKSYGLDLGVEVEVYRVKQDMLPELLDEIKKDTTIHGVIVQLPLANPKETDKIRALIPPEKDVDGLNPASSFTPATAEAINWLLSGYNVDLLGKKIVLLGNGTLVGAPLAELWEQSGYNVTIVDDQTENMEEIIADAEVIVSATGSPGVLHSAIIPNGTVVVDAGTTSESGKIVGDLNDDVYAREDLSLTPRRGGVGPLTIAALFENVLTAARGQRGESTEEA